jgi:hypothetical protein
VSWELKAELADNALCDRFRSLDNGAEAFVGCFGTVLFLRHVPGWRNGRRYGLKIRCPQGRAGSTPALGTTHFKNLQMLIL